MTPTQRTEALAELIRAQDHRPPECMCQVSPRVVAWLIAELQQEPAP